MASTRCATPGCRRVVGPPAGGRGARRRFCKVCRPPRVRPDRAGPAPAVVEVVVTGSTQSEPSLVIHYRQALHEAGALGSPAGSQVMHLVGLLAYGSHTAAGAASLSREIRDVFAAATRGRGAPDAVDELRSRREAKAARS